MITHSQKNQCIQQSCIYCGSQEVTPTQDILEEWAKTQNFSEEWDETPDFSNNMASAANRQTCQTPLFQQRPYQNFIGQFTDVIDGIERC